MTIFDDRLSEHDFEVCFANEPATSTDPAADLARGRARRRRKITAATGAAAAAVVVAVVTVSAQPTNRLEAIPAARPTPTSVPSERTFLLPPDADQRIYYSTIQSDPLPTPPPQTTVSSTAAVATGRRGGPSGTPTATLRLISAPNHLSSIPSRPEPYWVLVWPNTSPGIVSGPAMPNRKAQEAANKKRAEDAANTVCGDVTFVNANTGRQANGIWQNCTHR